MLKCYRFVDYATQGYLVVVGVLILLFHGGRVEGWGWLVAAQALVLGIVDGIIRLQAAGQGGVVIRFLRQYYPILLYTGFYRETGELNQMFAANYYDPFFIRLEEQLFGFQPSLALMEQFPQVWVSEIFYACYFSYYLMIGGIGLVLLVRNREQFFHFVSVVSFVFYLCYTTYIFVPVMGPRVFFGDRAAAVFGESRAYAFPEELLPPVPPEYPESVQRGPFYRTVIFLYRHFEAPGAAFPSSHVAVALATLYFSWRYLRRWRWVHTVVAIGLCMATVYCRYHYVVDVFAGMLATAVLLPLGNALYHRYERREAAPAERAAGPAALQTGRS